MKHSSPFVVARLAMFLGAIASPIAATALQAKTLDAERGDIVETFLKMRIVAAVLDTEGSEARPFPGPTDGLVSASWLRDRVERRHRDELGSARDAWGGSLLYWSNGSSYMIVSLGRDGRRQFDYDADVPYRDVPRSAVVIDPADDLVIVNGLAWRGPANQIELLRQAMSDVRSLGTAVESYAVDTNVYPGPVAPIADVAVIAGSLEPIYIRVMPRRDPWDNPYLFFSDTQHYAIVTIVSDGLPDHDYGAWGAEQFTTTGSGATLESGKDTIFVDGQFVQWPGAVQ